MIHLASFRRRPWKRRVSKPTGLWRPIARANPRTSLSMRRPESEPSSGNVIRDLELLPQEIRKEWVVRSRLLHVDGHDCSAAATAARWAREAHIPVTADLDNLYPGVEVLLENVDYVISSREFPARLCGVEDLFISLPRITSRFGCRLAAATLGSDWRPGLGWFADSITPPLLT